MCWLWAQLARSSPTFPVGQFRPPSCLPPCLASVNAMGPRSQPNAQGLYHYCSAAAQCSKYITDGETPSRPRTKSLAIFYHISAKCLVGVSLALALSLSLPSKRQRVVKAHKVEQGRLALSTAISARSRTILLYNNGKEMCL